MKNGGVVLALVIVGLMIAGFGFIAATHGEEFCPCKPCPNKETCACHKNITSTECCRGNVP